MEERAANIYLRVYDWSIARGRIFTLGLDCENKHLFAIFIDHYALVK